MPGRTWKKIDSEMAAKVKHDLMQLGGLEMRVIPPQEVWRLKFSDATVTYYASGTLYSTESRAQDPAVADAWKRIDSLAGSSYIRPTKDFLIGLDETGKGELIGHTVLTGVIFPKELFDQIDLLIGPADTKKGHAFEYWDTIFKNLDELRKSGFDFIVERIPPWHLDRYNLNKIMDVTYQKILSTFFRNVDVKRCRIVLDDYGITGTLQRFLLFLANLGAEMIVTPNAEDQYLEVKTASLISKRTRELVVKAINETGTFQVDGLSVGSGNAGNAQTLEWLKRWHATGKNWPWFIKRSFKTIQSIEGTVRKATKEVPPINEALLSQEFIDEFNKGNLSIQSLSLVCPDCGSILKGTTFAIFEMGGRKVSELKCQNTLCNALIRDAGTTLRYYCGYIVVDSSAIIRRFISNDLAASKFFENFTIILSPEVRRECDGTPTGKKEFDDLRRYSAIGRIELESPGSLEHIPDRLSNAERDERIIQTCLQYNAILVTADKSMASFASAKKIFVIGI